MVAGNPTGYTVQCFSFNKIESLGITTAKSLTFIKYSKFSVAMSRDDRKSDQWLDVWGLQRVVFRIL